MTPREFGEARQLYKFAIAGDCFWAVSKSCEQLITAGTQSNDPSYYVTDVITDADRVRKRFELISALCNCTVTRPVRD
jgi:hypothetical protein